MPKFTKRKIILISIIATIALAWCGTIFGLSNMDSQDSNSSSVSIVEKSIVQILRITNEYEITNSHPDPESLAHAAKLINAPLRKVVHASVYFVLAVLLVAIGVIVFDHRHFFWLALGVLAFCFVFAFFDEYHQTFVAGRTGQLSDVFIDTIGAVVGLLIASTYQLAWQFGRRSRQKSNSQKS